MQAGEKYKQKNVEEFLAGPIRQLFLHHDVHQTYGVSLLHRYFPIMSTERLVDYHHSATAWEVGSQTSTLVPKYQGSIVPRTFRFMGGGTVPYEFAFSETMPSETSHEGFLQELSGFLHDHGLEGILGVRLLDSYDPDRPMEVTEGKTNIMMPSGSVLDTDLIEALWVFHPEETQRCHCREYCFKSDGKHVENHGCS